MSGGEFFGLLLFIGVVGYLVWKYWPQRFLSSSLLMRGRAAGLDAMETQTLVLVGRISARFMRESMAAAIFTFSKEELQNLQSDPTKKQILYFFAFGTLLALAERMEAKPEFAPILTAAMLRGTFDLTKDEGLICAEFCFSNAADPKYAKLVDAGWNAMMQNQPDALSELLVEIYEVAE